MTLDDKDTSGAMRPGAIVGGAFLLVLGGTMFLDRTGFTDISLRHVIGPACLIILGMLMLVENGSFVFVCGRRAALPDGTNKMRSRRRGGFSGGLWLVGVGCWMLVSQLHLFGLDYSTSWPLLIILSGTIMLVRGTR